MTKKYLLVSFVLILFVLCALGALFMAKTEILQEKNNTENPAPPPKVQDLQNVSVQSGETEAYILRLRTQDNTVELVTKKSDGTQIITPVEGIKTYYLTDEDIKALRQGIEMPSREDMYILIEDLSS